MNEDKRIVTVLGDIRPDEAGFCHSHEHLCITNRKSAEINPVLCIDDPVKTVQELKDFKKAGGNTIVDAQPIGCGRQAEVLADLSAQSGVNIIAATGFHKMQFYYPEHWIFSLQADKLTDIFIRELTEGMYCDYDEKTPKKTVKNRAGFIKTALDIRFDRQYQKVFTAATDTALATGAPLMVHIENGSDPVMLANYFYSAGINMEKLIFCHMDRAVNDIGIHKEISRRGIYLEYDTIARPKYHNDNREAEIILEMVNSGLDDQLLLGLDVTRRRLKSYGGSPGLNYLIENFLPFLLQKGMSGVIANKLCQGNPAKAFSY